MENVNMVVSLEKVALGIRAAAILREAGRLAGNDSIGPATITSEKIRKAVKAYKETLGEMQRQNL